MEIRLERRSVKQIRLSAADAIDEGDTETLREDIMEAFTDEQIEEIERRIDTADFYDFLSEILDEWAGDDVDELFELLEAQLSEAGIDLKYNTIDLDDDEEEEDDEEDDEEDEDTTFGLDSEDDDEDDL
jgi:transcriptional regulator